MLHEMAASIGFRTARAIYSAGSKSNNKLHLGEHSDFVASRHNYKIVKFGDTFDEVDDEYIRRLKSAWKSLNNIRSSIKPDHFLTMGRTLINMQANASNCGELAAMAATSAYDNLGQPKPVPVALIDLEYPADHVFCVVGPRTLLERLQLSDRTIESLSASWAGNYIWAADPWLNILSKLKDYPALAEEKFNKWHLANKRIAWGDGPQGAGWYPPLGDYSRGFAAASLNVHLG